MKKQFFIRLKANLFSLIFAIILIAFLLCFIFGNFSYAVTDGISLFAVVILPSLFPFIFITSIISSLKIPLPFKSFLDKICIKLFKTDSKILRGFFISILCGYPLGAKFVSDMKKEGLLNEGQAKISAILCSTPSPSFCLSVVGKTMLNDVKFGAIIYGVSVLSSIISAILCAFFTKVQNSNFANFTTGRKGQVSFYDNVYSSVLSVLAVGGIITLFYLFSEMIFSFNILAPITYLVTKISGSQGLSTAICKGLLECTNGLKSLSDFGYTNIAVYSFLSSFGGVCVLMQSWAFLKREKIKIAPFILFKIIGAIISAFLSILTLKFF